jgi:DNA (cytosine-5)-methyltransferase 1
MAKSITYVDLFSGTGGFTLGLLQAGFTFKKHYFCETDPHAIANYQYHFPKAIPLGNIKEVICAQIKEKIDLLTFGFPCQDLSIAGQHKGLKGKRSSLFFEALRLIQGWKPRAFIFENVKGLFSANKGRAFETILSAIAQTGLYECQWQLCDTAWFLPQHRERIYFVATPGKETAPEIFPLPQSYQRNTKGHVKKAQTHIAPTIDTAVGKGSHRAPYVLANKWYHLRTGRNTRAKQIRKKNQSFGIDYNPFAEKEFSFSTKGTIGAITTSITKENLLAGYFQYDPSGKGYGSQDSRVYMKQGQAPTLSSKNFKIMDKLSIRRLTPLECERLQGFPDHWTQHGKRKAIAGKSFETIEISDTQRYKLMGNAVSVPVVKAVAVRLKPFFK